MTRRNFRFNTTVLSIKKAGDLFTLLIKKERADVAAGADAAPAYEHTCKVLVTATGLSKPNVPSNVDGTRHYTIPPAFRKVEDL